MSKRKLRKLRCWTRDKSGVEIDPGNCVKRYTEKRTSRYRKHKKQENDQ